MNNKLNGRKEYHFTPKLSVNNQLLDSKIFNGQNELSVKRTLTRVEENSTVNSAERPEMLVVKSMGRKNTLFFEETVEENELWRIIANPQWYMNLGDSNTSAFESIVNLSDAVIAFDKNYCFSYINKAASQILNRKSELLIGKTLKMVFPEIDWRSFRQAYEISRTTQRTFVVEQFIPSLNKWCGARIYYSLNGPLVLFFDIKAHKNDVKKLEENAEKYRMLVENMSDAIFTLDLDLNITYISSFVEKLLGEGVQNYLLKPLEKLICADSLKKFKKLFIEEMKQKQVLDYGKHRALKLETKYFKSDGTIVWLSVTLSFIRDYDGNLNEIFGVIQNITPQINIAIELLRSEKKLRLMNEDMDELRSQLVLKDEELKKALRKAEECDHLKSAFLANISHEIRTPMNGILGYTELLKDTAFVTEQQENSLLVIDRCGRYLLNVIDDIMSISKIESNQAKISCSKTNIDKQIKSVYDLFKAEAEQKGIDIFFNIPSSSKEMIISIDEDKVFVILTKLIKNALKFTKTGSVEFGYNSRLVDGNCNLYYYVKDTGIGIPDEKLGIIFDKFRQGEESLKRNIEGIGLGLTISKAYVEMLGGKIWVESTVGKGSIFYFTIPVNNLSECTTINREKLESQMC